MKQKLLCFFLLCTMLLGVVHAQERRISGKVTSAVDGSPLPGVSVIIEGSTIGTQTDGEGNYSLAVPNSAKAITFRYIGFTPQTLDIGTANTVNAVLDGGTAELSEVVVSALGLSREKKTLGYSSTQVGNEELTRVAPTNLVSGLQGKVAGADISTTSGSPGGSSKVVLRGFSSISGSNQPLYVVDGIPINNSRPGGLAKANSIGDLTENYDFGNSANDINPNDIESISILKGAAASSLYGSRASGGVILITTKKGKSGRLKVDFSSSASFTDISITPKIQDKFGQGWSKENWLAENGSWGPKFDGATRPWGSIVDGNQETKPFKYVENNFRDAFDLGKEFNNNLSLSGGNDNSTFHFSYGNINSDGILPGNNDTYKRNTISLNGSSNYKALTISASANYVGKNTRAVQTGQANSGIGSSFYEDVLQIPADYPISNFKDYNNTFYDVDNYFSPFSQNPYYSVYENGSRFKSDRFYGNVDVKAKASEWLTFQFQQGFDVNNTSSKIYNAKNNPAPGSWAGGGNDEGYSRQESVGNVIEGAERYFEFDSKLHALFNKQINSDFDINGLVGLNFNDRGSRALYTGVENLTVPGFYHIDNSSNTPVSEEAEIHRRLLGLYASATLGYRNFAYLTLNARNDWSSTLPENNRSFFYPGANLSVVLSEALDLSSAKISLLKVRAAWGQTGNDTDPYRIYNTIAKTSIPLGFGDIIFPIDGVNGFSISNILNNSNLKPEISTEKEFGGEVSFFDNRLGLDVTYYDRVTKDQILPIVVSPSTGVTSRIVNFGKIQNRGLEIALSGTPIKTEDFNWNVRYTFSKNRNKVLELPDGLDKVVLNSAYDAQFVAKVGEPLGVFEAPVPKYSPDGKIVVASNGFPVLDNDNGVYGTSQRKFIMGLTNALNYKNWAFSFTLDYKEGGKFYSGTADLLNFVGNDVATLYNDRRTFIVPNSVVEVLDGNGNVSYVENTNPISEGNFNAYFYTSNGKAVAYQNRILDKTFVKLRELTLSYSLPESVTNRWGIGRATLTAFGRNLFVWLPKENRVIDPEVSNLGNDLTSEFGEFRTGPSTRNYGLTLNLTF